MREATSRARALLGLTGLAVGVAMYAGASFAALLGARAGVWLAVGGAVALIAGHLVIGVVAYRRTMRAPWPHVKPLADDDDW